MKKSLTLLFLILSLPAFAQELEWIPFNWVDGTFGGKHFDYVSIAIPVTIDNLPYNFNMQFDLGANMSIIYENPIKPYLNKYSGLNDKLDSTLIIDGNKYKLFRNVDLKLGSVDFGNHVFGYLPNFGQNVPADSVNTVSWKQIGTIGPDIFQDKVLIIDYPNKRICVAKELPKKYFKASFQPFKIRSGRIILSFIINGKPEDLLFDSGTLFALSTTEKNAIQISDNKIIDSLVASSWGKSFMEYGRKTKVKIKLGQKLFKPTVVYSDKQNNFDKFYEQEQVWGLTGNAYFLNNVVIIDYKNKRFGIM